MSTDDHGAAPCWAGAVIVGSLVGSELGARQCAEVTLRRLLAVVLALASRKSARTRWADRNDVTHFMRTHDIRSIDELRRVDHRAVIAWERLMREEQGSQASTVRRRLAALSSLFAHLVKFGVMEMNPVRDVERPVVNRREGMTLAFSQTQARAILDKPDPGMLLGVRDRAILAVGLQVGFRRAEIAGLRVGDFHMNRGYDFLKVVRKDGKKGSLAIHPRLHSASVIISNWQDTAMISRDHSSDQCATIAKASKHAGPCASMRGTLAGVAQNPCDFRTFLCKRHFCTKSQLT